MKKKMMAVLLAGAMVLAAGCGSKEGKITVGTYKGLELTSVTQEAVEEEIQTMLEYYAELVVVDRAAEEGDTVNINYTGLLDGEAFEGGTDDSESGTDLELGSDSFIDGFEDGLIGAVAGESRSLNLTFPETYTNNPDMAGKAVVFEVTVNAVKEEQVPELTDAFIADKFTDAGYTTVEDYKEAVRKSLNDETYYEQVTEQLMASSEVEKYNESEVTERKEMLVSQYKNYAEYYGSFYGLDTETAIQYILGFESMDAFETAMEEYAYDIIKNAMIIEEIAKAESIEVTDEYYNTEVTELAEYYGYEDVASFEEDNGKDLIKDAMLSTLVMEFVIDNAVITEFE